MPPKRPYRAQVTGHASTAAIRGPGKRPHPHECHTNPRRSKTPPRRPYGAQGTATPPRLPYGAQGTGHASTAAIQGPRDRPCPHGVHKRHTKPNMPSRQPYGPTGPATPPRRPYGAQWTGHAPTTVIQSTGVWPRLHGGHTGPRRPATPPRRFYGSQEIGHTSSAAIREPLDRPRLHGGHARTSGPATPP